MPRRNTSDGAQGYPSWRHFFDLGEEEEEETIFDIFSLGKTEGLRRKRACTYRPVDCVRSYIHPMVGRRV